MALVDGGGYAECIPRFFFPVFFTALFWRLFISFSYFLISKKPNFLDCVAYETQVMPMLPQHSFEQGASIPEAFLTAFQNIFLIGEIKNNSKILVHAGARY